MDNVDKGTNNVTNDVKELYENAQDKASKLKVDIKNKSESVSRQVKETAADMYDEGKRRVALAEDFIEQYSDTFIKAIKDKPISAVVIATGVGYILSRIFKK